MGLKKEILHNAYNEDDEKLPGRTVSIKTQEGGPAVEYPIKVNKGGTGASTAAAARHNIGLGSVATEDIVPITKGGTGSNTVAGARSNLGVPEYETGTWTAQIYDLNTKVMEIPNQRFFRVGNIVIMSLAVSNFTPASAISTMLQVRNLPATVILGGNVCIAGLNGAAGNTTVQGMEANWIYIRPNVTLTTGTNYGWFTGVFFGTIGTM